MSRRDRAEPNATIGARDQDFRIFLDFILYHLVFYTEETKNRIPDNGFLKEFDNTEL